MAITQIDDLIKEGQLDEALADLTRRVRDWKGNIPGTFGKLLLFDRLWVAPSITTSPARLVSFKSFLLTGINFECADGIVPCVSIREDIDHLQRANKSRETRERVVRQEEENSNKRSPRVDSERKSVLQKHDRRGRRFETRYANYIHHRVGDASFG